MKKKIWNLVVMGMTVIMLAGCSDDKSQDTSEVIGVLTEKKDFMFVVKDADGTSYGFSFDEKPNGLDGVKRGEFVEVIYTGTISEIDPFTGEIISVKKYETNE